MKYLLFIVLLVAILITSGCVNENKNTVVTPTQATIQSSTIEIPTTPTVEASTIPLPVEITIPPHPARYAMGSMGKDSTWLLLIRGSGQFTDHLTIGDSGHYRFIIYNTENKLLKINVINWNGDKVIEIYDNTQDAINSEKVVELLQGHYYIWQVSGGNYTIQLGYGY